MVKGRIQWIDFAKGLVVILIVLGHVMPPDYAVRKVMAAFRMPFFFFMAGYLLNAAKWSPRFGEFAEKITKRLLFPYIIAEVLWYPIWFIFSHELGFLSHLWRLSEADPVKAMFGIFLGTINNNYEATTSAPLLLGPMWFFPCLFFVEIIYLGLYKIFGKDSKKFYGSLVVLAALGFFLGKFYTLPQGLDIALVMLILFEAGVLMKKHNFVEKINLPIIFASIIFLFVAYEFNIYVDTGFRFYGNPILFYLGSIGGTILCIKFSEIFTAAIGGKISDFISYCGLQSVLVIAMHIPIVMVIYDVVMGMGFFADDKLLHASWSVSIICLILGVTIPMWIAKKFGKKPLIKYFCN